MELRKRVKLRKLQHHPGPPRDAATEARRGRNAMLGMEWSGPGEAFQLGRPGAHSGPGILPWRRCVSVATGLLLAGLVALTQAWCVNAIHENLLWFSQLTVGVLTPRSFGNFDSSMVLFRWTQSRTSLILYFCVSKWCICPTMGSM